MDLELHRASAFCFTTNLFPSQHRLEGSRRKEGTLCPLSAIHHERRKQSILQQEQGNTRRQHRCQHCHCLTATVLASNFVLVRSKARESLHVMLFTVGRDA